MQLRRHRPLYQVCALVFLLWTAVDLTNAGLCALDNDPLGPLTSHVTVRAADGAGLPDAPTPHIDDCFCCSRCVEPTPMAAPADVDAVARRERLIADALPLPDRASIYHPPQSLS